MMLSWRVVYRSNSSADCLATAARETLRFARDVVVLVWRVLRVVLRLKLVGLDSVGDEGFARRVSRVLVLMRWVLRKGVMI